MNLFGDFRIATSQSNRQALVERICQGSRLHCTVESGVFYAEIADAWNDPQLLERRGLQFARLTRLLSELESNELPEALLTAGMDSLCIFIASHVAEEEGTAGIFERAKSFELDWKGIDVKCKRRRQELIDRLARYARSR